ncbi:MAG: hypothetical protein WC378_05255 [Opitutaceae bacterium]|jgi:hypothetical protein
MNERKLIARILGVKPAVRLSDGSVVIPLATAVGLDALCFSPEFLAAFLTEATKGLQMAVPHREPAQKKPAPPGNTVNFYPTLDQGAVPAGIATVQSFQSP